MFLELFTATFLLCSIRAQLQPLRVRDDGTFLIQQVTDLHYGERLSLDENTARVQRLLLETEQPDVVVMTGDMTSGYAWDQSPNWQEGLLKAYVQPFLDYNTSWAFAMGNHDYEANLSREEITELDMAYELSRTERGPLEVTGETNYVLPILARNSDDHVAHIWVFDSGNRNCLGVTGWDCIRADQVEWYRKRSKELEEQLGRKVPGYAFFHIPLPEYMNVWNNYLTFGELEDEGICCGSINTGLFAAFLERGDVKGVFTGHDHNNDYWGTYNGIVLAFGRKTGYGSYGPPAGWLRGARMIQIHEQNPDQARMWIRQEDGSVVASQPAHNPNPGDQETVCCGALGTSQCDIYAAWYQSKLMGRYNETFSMNFDEVYK